MVSQKDIKGLDFETIEEYFNYIVESLINGQKQQAKTLIKKLSRNQLAAFYIWLIDAAPTHRNEIIQLSVTG